MKLMKKSLVLILMLCLVLVLFLPVNTFAAVPAPAAQWDFDGASLSDNSAGGWDTPVVSGSSNITTGLLGRRGTAWKITHDPNASVGIKFGELPSSFNGAKQITISAWVKREELGQRTNWVDDWQTVFELHNAVDNKIIFNVKFGDYSDYSSPFSPMLNDNDTDTTGRLESGSSYTVSEDAFHHVVAVLDLSNTSDCKSSFYVDGVLWKSRGFNDEYPVDASWFGCGNGFPSGTTLYVGSNKNSKRQFNGLIDEVQVYNTALSADQVIELYQSYPLSPVGLWDFNSDTLSNSAEYFEWAAPVVTSGDTFNPITKGHIGKKEDAWRIRKIDIYGESSDYDAGINLGALPGVMVGTKTITMAAWIKPEGFADFQTIFELYNPNTSQIICTVRFGDFNGPTPFAPMLNDNNNFATGNLESGSSYTVSENAFHHVAAVLDFGNTSNCKASFYVDGVLWQSYGFNNEYPMDASWFGCGNGFPTGTTLYVGSSNRLRRQFNGLIDDVRVYGSALSADEITELYTGYIPAQVAVEDANCQLDTPLAFGENNSVILSVYGGANAVNTFYTENDTIDGVFKNNYLRISGIPSGLYVSGIRSGENTVTISFGGTAALPLIDDAVLSVVVYPSLTTVAGANSEPVSVYVKHDAYDFAALAGATVNSEKQYTVNLRPGAYQGERVCVIVAVYDDDELSFMKDVSIQNYTVTEENISVLTNSLDYTQGDIVKLFVWHDIDGMKPVKLFNLN